MAERMDENLKFDKKPFLSLTNEVSLAKKATCNSPARRVQFATFVNEQSEFTKTKKLQENKFFLKKNL